MKIELREYESRTMRLSDEAFELLNSYERRPLDVQPAGRRGIYRVKARHLVGSIVAPGMDIRITPKCPTRNLFYMLSYAYRLANLRNQLVGYEKVDDLLDFIVEIFIGQVEELVRSGLKRSYILHEDRLPVVRGKIQLPRLIRQAGSFDLTIPCEFEDFTQDVPFNQVIKYTLDQLCRFPLRSVEQILRLRRARNAFVAVHPKAFVPRDITRFSYDRLSEHYEPIHQLCSLILESCGIEHEAGQHQGGAFLVNMNALFERFVLVWLEQHVRPPLKVLGQHTGYLDTGRRVRLKPDICLCQGKDILLVADTKYKATESISLDDQLIDAAATNERVHNSDIYQVLSYCRGFGVRTGCLVFPDWSSQPRKLDLRDGENELVLDGIRLGGSTEEIEADLEGLLSRMWQKARVSLVAV